VEKEFVKKVMGSEDSLTSLEIKGWQLDDAVTVQKVVIAPKPVGSNKKKKTRPSYGETTNPVRALLGNKTGWKQTPAAGETSRWKANLMAPRHASPIFCT